MATNSEALHSILTTILSAYKSPSHALGAVDEPESWTAYGTLPLKLLSLIGSIGDLPGSYDDLNLNDQGKLKATLSNELQLEEKHAIAVIHAQTKFMQTVVDAAVDAVTEVSQAIQDAPEGDEGDIEDEDQGDNVAQNDSGDVAGQTTSIAPDELAKPDPDTDSSPPTVAEPVASPGASAPPAEEIAPPVPNEAPASGAAIEPAQEVVPAAPEAAPEEPVKQGEPAPAEPAAETPVAAPEAAPEAAEEKPSEEGGEIKSAAETEAPEADKPVDAETSSR